MKVEVIKESRSIKEDLYTIDYIDITGANFSDKIRGNSAEDARAKFLDKSKRHTNKVVKIKDIYIANIDDYDDNFDGSQDDIYESVSNTEMFIRILRDIYQDDCDNNDDPEFDCDPQSDRYQQFIDDLKEFASESDEMFDNLTHTISGKIDELVDEGYSYKEIIDTLIAEAQNEFRSLKEGISDTPIEDIEAFITEVKERFPGSEAVFDGDTNEIRISLR